jgi:hypothetical protein
MRRTYSRLNSVEEKRNIKKAIAFSVFTIVLIILIFFFGITSAAKFATFIRNLTKSTQTVDNYDITPPAPPRINSLPEVVNKSSVTVAGNAEPGASVEIFINDAKSEVVANNDGDFSSSAELAKGANLIYALAKDSSGNISQKSSIYTVLYDTEKLQLTISYPTDQAKFVGDKQKHLTITGNTKPESTLTINNRLIRIDDSGGFSYTTDLSEGDNSFTFKVTDSAGSSTEKTVKVNFAPY